MTAARSRAVWRVRWALTSAPPGVLPLYLTVEAVAVALVLSFPGPAPVAVDWVRFLALLAVAALQTELSLGIEKARRLIADGPHNSMTSVWTFGGALVLPAAMAAVLTAAVYLHLWLRVWRLVEGRAAYRVAFASATIVLGCLAVPPVLRLFGVRDLLADPWGGGLVVLAVVVAALVYTTINGTLVAVGIKLHHRDRPWRATFGGPSEGALEFATLSLGGMTAVLLVTRPVLVVLVLLPAVVLHRTILMRQLEEKAAQDAKTGLLTAAEWQVRVANELIRNTRDQESFGVLMVDLDRFKRVNDTYGHVAGDVVLRAVAKTITRQLRAYDCVGRWGGEEFAVLLPRIPDDGARDVAERIRAAVTGVEVTVAVGESPQVITGMSASVGVACFPAAGTTVDGLVHAADQAMYRAKHAGRNTVMSFSDPRPNLDVLPPS